MLSGLADWFRTLKASGLKPDNETSQGVKPPVPDLHLFSPQKVVGLLGLLGLLPKHRAPHYGLGGAPWAYWAYRAEKGNLNPIGKGARCPYKAKLSA